jgi:hypothetical protein
MISHDDTDPALDEEFPLGDGTADTAIVLQCPYCAEDADLTLDPGGGATQDYVEDCQVCCQPWRVHVEYRGDGTANVSLTPLDD